MNLTERMHGFWIAHPDTWVAYSDLAHLFGMGGWRTRVSECRKRYGMVIEQRPVILRDRDGRQRYRLSEYRYTTNGGQP